MKKQYILYGHGGSYNHGCEALTRATIVFLRQSFSDCSIALSTHFAEQDKEFALPADTFVERNVQGKTNAELYAPTIARIAPDSVCLHVGGDNYCYRNWQRWAEIHYKALERGAKSILWSSSIDPEVIDDEMLAALRTHHLITARECMTYNALLERGLSNVVRVSDIAFTLEPEPVDFHLENFVALNMSPLVLRKNPAIMPALQALLDDILSDTDMNVALVPHVVQSVDNDYDALKMLNTHGSDRVRLVSDKLSAAQYKYVISKARFCVTARTHAAIAAYSSLVPTLAIGYSVKSQGIAADLEMLEYLLGIEQILSPSDMIDAFNALMKDEANIRKTLASKMPQYIKNAIPVNWSW